MTHLLQELFSRLAADVKIDKPLVDRIHRFERNFVTRDAAHINFFGGNTMGVHRMRFLDPDTHNWFGEVIRLDQHAIREGVERVPSIQSHWVRANDAMNHSCIWLLHAIHHSSLPTSVKEQAKIDTMLCLQYKFLGSLMGHYFKFPADEASMLAAYARLSYKYSLKQAGSWAVLLHRRSEEIVSPRSVHFRTYVQFNDDAAIVNMFSDIQARLREIVKSYWAVFDEVRTEGVRIVQSTAMFETDTGPILLDKRNRYETYRRYAHDCAADPSSWAKPELAGVVMSLMPSMPPRAMEQLLAWIPTNHSRTTQDNLNRLIDLVLTHAFDLMQKNRAAYDSPSSLPALLTKLKALYMASRMSDQGLLQARRIANDLAKQAIDSRSDAVVASARTSLMLYIVLRTMAMQHYTH